MKVIKVKLLLEDSCNPSYDEAVKYVTEILNEAFGKEARQEFPRVKLILIEVKHQ
jgi:hypothetical protein